MNIDDCKSDLNDNIINNDQNSNSNSNPTFKSCDKRKYREISSFNANEQQQRNVKHRVSHSNVDNDYKCVDSDDQNISSPELTASPATPEPMALNPILNNTMNHQKIATKIVIDYDDTIYPTSFIMQIIDRKPGNKELNIRSRLSSEELKQLEHLSNITYHMLLRYLTQYGNKNIFIVSAAHKEWIEYSLEIVSNIGHYGAIHGLLFINPPTMIKIYTASDTQLLPWQNSNAITKYKLDTFEKLLNNVNNSSSYHLLGFVSIGDGKFEYEAAKILRDNVSRINEQKGNTQTMVHRIKLKSIPHIIELMVQQYYIIKFCGMYEMFTLDNKEQIEINFDNQ